MPALLAHSRPRIESGYTTAALNVLAMARFRLQSMALLLIVFSATSAGAQTPVTEIISRAEVLVAEERYDEAVEAYRLGLLEHPEDVRLLRLMAETLSWSGHYAEAIAIFREILASQPDDQIAFLAYARTLQWSGDYRAARRELRRLLDGSPENLDALEELARTNYWSGDFRRAARQYVRLLHVDPTRELAAQELAQIRAVSRPIATSTVSWRSDDQPLQSAGLELEVLAFSDPLTSWTVALGARELDARSANARVSSLRAGFETSFPAASVSFGASLGPTDMPTGATEWFGSAWVDWHLGEGLTGGLFYERHELLWTAASIETAAFVDSVGAAISYDRNGYFASVRVRELEFFDGNEGSDASGYLLMPLRDRDWTLSGGLSFLLRETSESRFVIGSIDAEPAEGGFDYQYEGIYDPYWSPLDLREVRLLLSANGTIGSFLEWRIDSTAGVARDDAVAFGPASGLLPTPAETFRSTYERRYHPWSLALTLHKQWGKVAFQVRLERTVTVHYEADEAIATLVRRF